MWSALIAPAFAVLINFLIYYSRPELFGSHEISPALLFTSNSLNTWCLLMMPLFVTLITFYVNYTEHKANGWKYIYSLPLPKISVFSAKFFVSVVIVFFSMALYYILNYAAIKILSVMYPDIPFRSFNDSITLLIAFSNVFIASLGILSIQFFVSLVVNNFVFPIGFGVILTFANAMLLRWEHIIYFPYSYPFFSISALRTSNVVFLSETVVYSLIAAAFVFTAGYFVHWRTNIK